MNGRVYDPEIGVFLSADPLVQFPCSTQGLNRYAYVGNNPLSYTDPSGHLIFGLVAMAIIVKANVTWYAAMAIAAVAGYLDTGDLKAGIFSGISAGLAYGAGKFVTGLNIGNPFTDAFVRATTHGLVQGAVGAAQGGRFGSAALAGFTSSILGPTPDGGGFSVTNTPLGDVIQSAIVGGTASKIGGGKFANGAMTGAFVQALNHQHQKANTNPDSATLEAGDSLSGFEIDQLGATKIFNKLGLGNVPDSMSINMDGIHLADEMLAAAVPADQLIKALQPGPVQRLSPVGIIKRLFLNSARGTAQGYWHSRIDRLDIGMGARSGIKYNSELMTRYRELPRE